MDLRITVEQRLLADAAARFFTAPPTDLWAGMATQGWIAMTWPEAMGGAGLGLADAMAVLRESGRRRVPHALVPSAIQVGALLAALAPDWEAVEALSEGRLRAAPAWEDDPARPLRARSTGGEWVLTGRKRAALAAPGADWLLVSAAVEAGMAVFALPPDHPGLRLRSYEGLGGINLSDLRLDEVLVPAAARLGGEATAALSLARDAAAAAACAEALGLMDSLLTDTAEHLRTRIQFGRKLADFQALQHRLARIFALREEAEGMAMLAALRHASPRAVASAKLRVGAAARFIGQQAVQLHGGMGVTDELPLGRAVRMLLAFEMAHGTGAEQARRLATLALAGRADTALLEEAA
jgi:alkylation response protein AidB-like acyl-CoA dehydrogenase